MFESERSNAWIDEAQRRFSHTSTYRRRARDKLGYTDEEIAAVANQITMFPHIIQPETMETTTIYTFLEEAEDLARDLCNLWNRAVRTACREENAPLSYTTEEDIVDRSCLPDLLDADADMREKALEMDPDLTELYDQMRADCYLDIASQHRIGENHLSRRVREDPNELADIFIEVAENSYRIRAKRLDHLLGIPSTSDRRAIDEEIETAEQDVHVATSYRDIFTFLDATAPEAGDVVYDLGAGYGRVVATGALLTDATWKGVEMVPERVTCTREALDPFSSQADMIEADVRNIDYADGDIFYMFEPFTNETKEDVVALLAEEGREREIQIFTRGDRIRDALAAEDWTHEIDLPDVSSTLTHFRSVP